MKTFTSLLLIAMCISSNAFSTEYFRNRTIIGAGISQVADKSLLYFDIDGAPQTLECAVTQRFAFSSDEPNYKEMVSIVMTAYALGQNTVEVYATDYCNSNAGNAQSVVGVKIGSMAW